MDSVPVPRLLSFRDSVSNQAAEAVSSDGIPGANGSQISLRRVPTMRNSTAESLKLIDTGDSESKCEVGDLARVITALE